MTQMTNCSQSRKHDQVFISFRGTDLRESFMSFLQPEFEKNNINFYIDENDISGLPIKTIFQRIRESGVALIFISQHFSESTWCLDELVEINKQMEKGCLYPLPVFYKVKSRNVQNQTGWFGNHLLKTEDKVRMKVNRSSTSSILETEARIWGWRQALDSVIGRTMGLSYKHRNNEVFLRHIVVKVKTLLGYISSPSYVMVKPLNHPQETATLSLQAIKFNQTDLDELLIKKPYKHINCDHLVFLDLISRKSPFLTQRSFEPGSIFLVLLGSLKVNEGCFFKPVVLPKKLTQEHQCQSHTSLAQVTNSTDSIDNLRNNSDDAMSCYSFICNILNRFAMSKSPPTRRVSISFDKKQPENTLLVTYLKRELELNQITVDLEDDSKERFKETKVVIVIFSFKYPASQECLDELVEIKKLMDAGEIVPFPVFYNLDAESVKQMKGWFYHRLLKREDEVRRKVDRGNDDSILDIEAKIWGWRQAILSIVSKPCLSIKNGSAFDVSNFVSNVVTRVKELVAIKETQRNPTDIVVQRPLIHRQERAAATTIVQSLDNELFYTLNSFLRALNFETTVIEGFRKLPNGLVSLSMKGNFNLLFISFSSLEKVANSQLPESFKFLEEGLALNPSGSSRFEDPSRFLALESNQSQQLSENRLTVSSIENMV